MIYGGDEPIAAVRAAVPDVRTMSRDSLEACLIRYVGYGWTGTVPDVCRSMMIFVPINVAPWLFGGGQTAS